MQTIDSSCGLFVPNEEKYYVTLRSALECQQCRSVSISRTPTVYVGTLRIHHYCDTACNLLQNHVNVFHLTVSILPYEQW